MKFKSAFLLEFLFLITFLKVVAPQRAEQEPLLNANKALSKSQGMQADFAAKDVVLNSSSKIDANETAQANDFRFPEIEQQKDDKPMLTLHIHAPDESTDDVLDNIKDLKKLENEERKAAEDDFLVEKKKLVEAQRIRIRDIVHTSFEAVNALIPNPIKSDIRNTIRKLVKTPTKQGFLELIPSKQENVQEAQFMGLNEVSSSQPPQMEKEEYKPKELGFLDRAANVLEESMGKPPASNFIKNQYSAYPPFPV